MAVIAASLEERGCHAVSSRESARGARDRLEHIHSLIRGGVRPTRSNIISKGRGSPDM